jgi:hypothetical protein
VARCPAHEDRSPSLSIRDGASTVLVHCHAGCTQDDVITALRGQGLWPEAEKPIHTAQEKSDWSRRQRQIQLHLADAERWRRAAVLMAEEELVRLKAALFDPAAGPAEPDLVRWYTTYLAFLGRLSESDEWLVNEYLRWRRDKPWLTAGMVGWARNQEVADGAALERIWQAMEEAE